MATISAYNHIQLLQGKKLVDLQSTGDTFKLALMTNSHVFTATHTAWTNVSANEITSANGYLTPGQNLASLSWTETGGTATWDAANVTWTATGGSITAYHAVLYDDTVISPADALFFSIDFQGIQTAADTTPFNVNWNASGIYTVS